ncbi:5-formyltetrahydrofolate cyclo-ligase [Bacillus piscicola]|uniref:5-formyltetrahydrofolate cyclo-ligase n=1 Tax=Bacillus piscicola TaxID=1632684 RepID=UPI001F08D405|nr:5-formyltetrahydrofolate cyclo-ligase [Bacillus piscicola]
MTKRDLRLYIRNQFNELRVSERETECEIIYNRLFQWTKWQEAQTVAVTMATRNEIDTAPIIERGWEEGKRMVIPRADPLHHALHFYEIHAYSETEKSFAGICEPDPEKTTYIAPEYFDLIIVPGLAFDVDKFRVGFGGGYYDRLLSTIAVPTCALALEFQLFEHIPHEKHDISLTAIITANSIIM